MTDQNVVDQIHEDADRHNRKQREQRGDRRGPRRPRREEDDKGTVMDCLACGMGFFSRWEASTLQPTCPAKFSVCERCVTNRLFEKNMATLSKN